MAVPCAAFIYQIHILRRWNNKTNQFQYVVGLSDYHEKSHQINKEHRAYLEKLFTTNNDKNIKVVVEDLSAGFSIGAGTCGRFTINSRGGVLGGLADVCRNAKIDVSNIEYRYCRVAAFGPIIKNCNKPIATLKSTNSLTIDAVYNEIMNEINNIRKHSIDSRLRNAYKNTFRDIIREMKQLKLVKYKAQIVSNYFEICTKQVDQDARLEFCKRLLIFDSDLLDLKLVQVINETNKDIVIAITGGTHIKHAAKLLQRVGYESIFKSQINSRSEYDLSQCLGSHIIDGAFCVKPEAIDMSVLEQMIVNNLEK